MVSGMFCIVINQYSYVYKVTVVVYIFPGEDCARILTALFQFPYKRTSETTEANTTETLE